MSSRGALVLGLENVFKNPTVPKGHVEVWTFALLIGSVFAMSAYWYLHIWKPLQLAEQDGPSGDT